jgi:hypothetical protein
MGRLLRLCQRIFGIRNRFEYEDVQEPDRIEDQPYSGDPSIVFSISLLLGLGARHCSPLSRTDCDNIIATKSAAQFNLDPPENNNAPFIVPDLRNSESIVYTGFYVLIFFGGSSLSLFVRQALPILLLNYGMI